jgi:hypothetical protein
MHQFICNSVGRKIVPLQVSKSELLNKLLDSYEELGMKFKVSIEVIEKNINEQQQSLYRAFILKASQHFGNTYNEMEEILKRFQPINAKGQIEQHCKPISIWTSKELDDFINQASVLLAEHGFKF